MHLNIENVLNSCRNCVLLFVVQTRSCFRTLLGDVTRTRPRPTRNRRSKSVKRPTTVAKSSGNLWRILHIARGVHDIPHHDTVLRKSRLLMAGNAENTTRSRGDEEARPSIRLGECVELFSDRHLNPGYLGESWRLAKVPKSEIVGMSGDLCTWCACRMQQKDERWAGVGFFRTSVFLT